MYTYIYINNIYRYTYRWWHRRGWKGESQGEGETNVTRRRMRRRGGGDIHSELISMQFLRSAGSPRKRGRLTHLLISYISCVLSGFFIFRFENQFNLVKTIILSEKSTPSAGRLY